MRYIFVTWILLLFSVSVSAFGPSSLKPSSGLATNLDGKQRYMLKMSRNIFENEPGDVPPPGAAGIGAFGIGASAVCFYSLYVLRTTTCGLPPGPFGLEGAIEGISYLVVTWIFSWSVFKKVKTGSGLNTDPAGLLGAAEGLSFLVVLGGIAIAVLNLNDYGFLPGFLPNDKCFGIND